MNATPHRLPFLLLPGLLASPRLFAAQVPLLWRYGPVMVGDTTQDDSMAGMARRVLADAPPRFALLGLSMGGYLSFEILRQAPERVALLMLLDTSARPESPEATALRTEQMAMARDGHLDQVMRDGYERTVHPSRARDDALRLAIRDMSLAVGPAVYERQQQAIMARPDSRPLLPAIACPTLVLVGDGDQLTPPEHADEIAGAIPGARRIIIPECGHLATMERPREVNEALQRWLDGQGLRSLP